MKEIYKIPKGQNIATSEGWKHIDTVIKDFVYTTEQVPTNWEELKTMCKDIKGNKRDLGGAMWFEFGTLNDSKVYLGKALVFDQKGQVGMAEKTFGEDISITIFAQNRTPQQMWQIIKNLIGEE